MKILVVAYKFGTEQEIGEHLGTYHYFIEMMRRLKSLGHEVVVVAPWLSFAVRGSTNVDGVSVRRYYPPLWNSSKWFFLSRPWRWWYLRATADLVLRLDKEENWDAILVWQARETGYAVAKIASKLRAPFLFRQITAWKWHFERTSRDVFGKRSWYKLLQAFRLTAVFDALLETIFLEKKLQLKYAKMIYENADRIVFVSQALSLEGVALGLHPRKIKILGVGIETDLFRPSDKKEELRKHLGIKGSSVVLFIGRISFAEKGIGVLLSAMAEVIAKVRGANLVIVGSGEESERMREMIEKLRLASSVQLVGKKPFGDLAMYLNASDVLAVPSLWLEGFGQVTIEAMACGVPVVTSDVGGSLEININGQTGFVVPAGDYKKLAEALITSLSDENLRQRLGMNARARVLQNYTYEVLIEQFLKIIQNAREREK